MDATVKHYIYISDAKVDMLYLQIDKKWLEKIAVELSIDLKLLGSGVGVKIKPNQPEETRYSKLRLVVEYVEKHLDVGWVDAPGTYFKGSINMIWGLLYGGSGRNGLGEPPQPPYAIYFGGKTDRTELVMVGSAHHIIGFRGDVPKSNIILFYTPAEIVRAIVNEAEPSSLGLSSVGYLSYEVSRVAELGHQGRSSQLEFLAKTYLYDKLEEGQGGGRKSFLVGSPIYVAFAN